MTGPWQDAEQARASWSMLGKGTRVALCRSVNPSPPAVEPFGPFHTFLLRPPDHTGEPAQSLSLAEPNKILLPLLLTLE